jgi:hypothetical protein
MVSLTLSPSGGVGFRTKFAVSFEKILPSLGPIASPPPPVKIPTIVPVSSSFFEADIEIKLDETEAGNTFTMTVYGLADDIYSLLAVETTIVHISLGYDDGAFTEVMAGLLTDMDLQAGEQWYEATLSGVDLVFEKLQRPRQLVDTGFPNKTVGDIAAAICKQANVASQVPEPGPTLKTFSAKDDTPLSALMRLARTPTPPFSVQARDGKLWLGVPQKIGNTLLVPITDGATSRPVMARGATAAANPMTGQDFKISGIPSLRPSDVVTLGSDQLRIQAVTHKFTRYGGYVCTGRALSPSASHDDAQKAGQPSASVVARQLQQNLLQRDRNRPAVDIGEVNAYKSGAQTATLDLGHDSTADMPSPSVQATLRDKPVSFNDKPISSPFAFFGCGLVTPVFPKMRALLTHAWNEPEDAVCNGFVWTSEMKPPNNQAGDWWLRLPTQLDSGSGQPTGAVVDDLTAMNGQRVIKVKGMTITIGAGLLGSAGGDRPKSDVDESLTVTAGQKTKLTVKDGKIEMAVGGVTLTVGDGKVSVAQNS